MKLGSILKAGLLASTSAIALLDSSGAAQAQAGGPYVGLSVGYQSFWGDGLDLTCIGEGCSIQEVALVLEPMQVRANGVAGGIFGGYGMVIPGTMLYLGGEAEFYGTSANGITGVEGQMKWRAKYGVTAGPRLGLALPGALAWFSPRLRRGERQPRRVFRGCHCARQPDSMYLQSVALAPRRARRRRR